MGLRVPASITRPSARSALVVLGAVGVGDVAGASGWGAGVATAGAIPVGTGVPTAGAMAAGFGVEAAGTAIGLAAGAEAAEPGAVAGDPLSAVTSDGCAAGAATATAEGGIQRLGERTR
jgi:hypothetical protein